MGRCEARDLSPSPRPSTSRREGAGLCSLSGSRATCGGGSVTAATGVPLSTSLGSAGAGTSQLSAFRLRGNRRGAAYLLALTTLLVGVALALAMLRAGGAYFDAEDSRQKKQAAVNLAEAGIDYACWQVHYRSQPLPYTADVTLATGRFQVQATDGGSKNPSSMLVTSTGISGSHRHTISRTALGLLPYHYLLCENRKIDEGRKITSTGSGLGLRANGDIKLSNSSNSITTGVWATAGIVCSGTVTPRNPNGPPIAFPDISSSYYDSIATHSFGGSITVTSMYLPSGAVVVTGGNVNISGWYWGTITIVAAGNIEIKGNLWPATQDSYLALLTQTDINIESTATYVQAIMYAHKPDGSGDINCNGVTTVVGSMCADDVHCNSDTALSADTRINLDIMRQLRLPGL